MEASPRLLKMKRLWTDVEACTLCEHLLPNVTKKVFGDGNVSADIVVVGEGPGEEEDATGHPFVGEAGQLLTDIIHHAGLTREEIFICNAMKCFLPGTTVSGEFVGGLKAHYSGPARELITARGHRLRVTANHPILTYRGPVAARLLSKGDTLFTDKGEPNGPCSLRNIDHENGPSRVENVFDALARQGTIRQRRATNSDLHGDGARLHSNVNVVSVDRKLTDSREASICQGVSDKPLIFPDSCLSQEVGLSPLDFLCCGDLSATGSGPSGATLALDQSTVLLDGRPLQGLRFGPAANWDFRFSKNPSDYRSSHAEILRQLILATSGQILPDKLVSVRDFQFSGHIYDLQSTSGWIVSQGIVSSNCRCWSKKGEKVKNRTPRDSEIDKCRVYLGSQLNIVRPKVVVGLGGTAIAALKGAKLRDIKSTQMAGLTERGKSAWYLWTYHPAYPIYRGRDVAIIEQMVGHMKKAKEMARG